MVRGLNECVHMPNLVERQSMTKTRHLRPFPTVDHRFDELMIAEFCREDVRSAGAGAVMTDQAFASIDIATGRDGPGLAEERIGQDRLCVHDSRRRETEQQSCEAKDKPSARRPMRHNRGSLHDYCFGSIFSMTWVLYKSPSSTLPSMANTQSIPPFGAE